MALGDLFLYLDNLLISGNCNHIYSFSYQNMNLNKGEGIYHTRNCENFAASLLMPKDMFLTSLSSKVGSDGISYEIIDKLALEFGVNFKASYQRVKVLTK